MGAGELIRNNSFRVGTSDQGENLNGRFESWNFNGAAPTDWVLPLISGPLNRFEVKNIGSANLTILTLGTDEIFDSAPGSSLVLLPGDAYTFINNKYYWIVYP